MLWFHFYFIGVKLLLLYWNKWPCDSIRHHCSCPLRNYMPCSLKGMKCTTCWSRLIVKDKLQNSFGYTRIRNKIIKTHFWEKLINRIMAQNMLITQTTDRRIQTLHENRHLIGQQYGKDQKLGWRPSNWAGGPQTRP